MINKKFTEFIAKKLNIKRQELVEKDIILQSILQELNKDTKFKEEFAFKGGTCLIKGYLGYYRFSEDLDFTYIHQKEFNGKSEKTIRKLLSHKIDFLLILLKKISNKFDLSFESDKNNKNYVEHGGSNKFVTFKIWYDSEIMNQKTFIKIQVNFVEKLFYSLKEIQVKSIINSSVDLNLSKEIKFLFKEYAYLEEQLKINSYSLKEIFIEKIRAIITRRGVKARDFIDVYLIQKETKIDLKTVEGEIVDKIVFMLKYEKYIQNIKIKSEELEKEIILGKEEVLLLKKLPSDFQRFVNELKPFLQDIIVKIFKKQEKKKQTEV